MKNIDENNLKTEAKIFVRGFSEDWDPNKVVVELTKLGHTSDEIMCLVNYFRELSPESWVDICNEEFEGESYEEFKAQWKSAQQ